MFSKRASLNGSRKYSREFFEKLCSDLTQSGFDQLNILLPHNIVKIGDALITVDEFLKRERNYPALILIAKSTRLDETLKVLFVNRNLHCVFADDTFPNAKSEPPQIYFQSPDPGRVYAVFEFFREYVQSPSILPWYFNWTIGSLSMFFVLLQFLVLFSSRKGLLMQFGYTTTTTWDILVTLLASYLLFQYFAFPKGLWIKPHRELHLLYLFNMAIRGEYRDNPLVALIFSVLGTIIAALILKLLGLV